MMSQDDHGDHRHAQTAQHVHWCKVRSLIEVFVGVPVICVSVGCGNMSGETDVVMVVSSQWRIHKGGSAGVLA